MSANTDTIAAEEPVDIWAISAKVLSQLGEEREREIISRRFGLYERKETLEQIGELLGITRERVRQLEKSITVKLAKEAQDLVPHLKQVERTFIKQLHEMGRAARLDEFTEALGMDDTDHKLNMAHVNFLATLIESVTTVNENDSYHLSLAINEQQDEKHVKKLVDQIHSTVKEHGQPLSTEKLHELVDQLDHPDHIHAIARISKKLATLNGQWGLVKWPSVNPKNIRDKIQVTMIENGGPMHFADIADKIRSSGLKRSDVTVQAIHNELIKDERFVLIGRGIYALKEWGYSKGTVADVITEILKNNSGEPMHRDEIAKAVLKKRDVKPTTILLNLQSKPQFVRVAKATYSLANNS